jgi:CheY-like chemotaxis protein
VHTWRERSREQKQRPQLLAAVRKTNPHIAAVAVTAFARLDDRSRSLAAGFHAHVSKPIDPQAFMRTLAGALVLPKKD